MKKQLLFIFALSFLFLPTLFAQNKPINDEKTGALLLKINPTMMAESLVEFDFTNATMSNTGGVCNKFEPDLWYSFVPNQSFQCLKIIAEDLPNNLVIQLHKPDGATQCFYQKKEDSYIPLYALEIGKVYFVQFAKNNLKKGSIAALTPPIPQNDEFYNAIPLPNSSKFNPNISGTTLFSLPSKNLFGEDNDVWYKFVATEVSHIIQLTNVQTLIKPSFFDKPIVQLYTENDFQKNVNFTKDQPDVLAFNNLIVGQIYYLRVLFESDNIPFFFDISVSSLEKNAPNPSCEKAISLPVNQGTEATLLTEAAIMLPSTEHSGNKENHVWFKFVATSNAHFFNFFRIDANESYDVDELKIYKGDCGSLIEIPYNNSSDNKVKTEIGKTYYIAASFTWNVWEQKKFRIAVLTAPNPPSNDECKDAIELPITNGFSLVKTKGNLTGAFSSSTSSSVDVWYKFIANAQNHLLFFKKQHPDTYFSIGLHKNQCSLWAGTNVNASDSIISLSNLEQDALYYLRVSSSASSSQIDKTDFEIAVFSKQVANDECSKAIKLDMNKANQPIIWTKVNTKFATYTPLNEPSLCNVPNNGSDIWFQFTTQSEEMLFKVQGNIYAYIIYDAELGNCSNLKLFNCSATSNSSNWAELITGLAIGRKYYLRLINITDEASIALIQQNSLSNKPINDNFSNSTPISINTNDYCNLTQSGTLYNATKEDIQGLPDINNGNVIDVWYKFTATTKWHFITLQNFSFPTVSYYTQLYKYQNNTLSFIKYIEYGAEKDYGFVAGETYYIRIWVSKNTTIPPNHEFEICITTPFVKANDEACNAHVVPMLDFGAAKPLDRFTSSQIFKGSIPQICNNNFENYSDFWFKFKATATEGMVILDAMLDKSNQPVEDEMIVGVYQGGCNNLSAVVCPEVLRKNKLYLPQLVVGKEYFIRIIKYDNSDDNTFGLFVEQIPKLQKVVNDDCNNSIHLEVNIDFVANKILNTHNFLSTASKSMNTCPNTANKLDVWFDFTATQDKHYLIIEQLSSIVASEYRYSLNDLKIDLYEGNCNSLVSKDCDINQNKLEMTGLKVGQKYLIRVHYAEQPFYATWQFFNIIILSPTSNSPDNYCWGTTPIIPMKNIAPFTKLISSTIHKSTSDKFYTACYKLKPTSSFIVFEFDNATGSNIPIVELSNGTYTALNNFPVYQKVFKVDTNTTYSVYIKSVRVAKFQTTIRPFSITSKGLTCANPQSIPLNSSLTPTKVLIDTVDYGNNPTSRFYEFTATNTSHYIFVRTENGSKTIVLNTNCAEINLDDEDYLGNYLYRLDHLTPGQKVTFGLHFLNGTYQIAALTMPQLAANDNCSGAITLEVSNNECSKPRTFVHKFATSDNLQVNEICSNKNTTRQTLWYKFKAISSNANLTISNIKRLNPLDYKGSVSIFKSSNCQTFIPIRCDEKDFMTDKNLSFTYDNLQVNTEYFIRISLIDKLPTDSTRYDICISNQIIASNFDCANATLLQSNKGTTIGHRYKGNFDEAIQKTASFQCGLWNRELWLKFVAASNKHIIVIKGEANSTTFGGVFAGNCNNLSQLICLNQDTVAAINNLIVGNTYYIRLFSNYNSSFPKVECYLMHDISPQNERCATATKLPTAADNLPDPLITSQITWADEGRYFNCDFQQLNDVWFSFKATSTKQKIHFKSLAFENDRTQLYKLAVTSGTCNSPIELGCITNPADTNNTGLLLSNLTIGSSYNICVRNLRNFGANKDIFKIGCLPSNHKDANTKCQTALELPVNDDINLVDYLDYNSAFIPAKTLGFNDESTGEAWFKFIAKAKTQKIIIKDILTEKGYFFKVEAQTQANNCNEPLIFIPETSSEKTLENLIVGKTYFIKALLTKVLIDKTLVFRNNVNGNFKIGVISLPNRPENDLPSRAKPIALSKDSSYVGTTQFASSYSDPNLSSSICRTSNDVWYRFKSKDSKHPLMIQINNIKLNGGFDLNPEYELLELVTFSSGNQTLFDGSCGSIYENKTWTLKPQTDYFIRIYNDSWANDPFQFTISAFYTDKLNEINNESIVELLPKIEKCIILDTKECNFSEKQGIPIESCGFNNIPKDAWISYVVTNPTLHFNLKKYPLGAIPSIVAYRKEGAIFKPMSHLCFFDSLTNLILNDTIALRVWSKNNIEGEYEICLAIDKSLVSSQDNHTTLTDKILLFPNPATDKLTIKSPILNAHNPIVKVFNLQGQIIFNRTLASYPAIEYNIDISDLPQGAYLLQLCDSKQEQKQNAIFIKTN
jgi:hypothetical protein